MQLTSSSQDGMPLRQHDRTETVPDPADDGIEIAVQPQSDSKQPDDPFFIGATLQKRYRIDSLLFSDENSLIYRARDLRWDLGSICTDVGIKVFRPELRMQPQWVARLKREFYQTRLIKHPNIVRMYGLECHEGHWFIAMELLRGVSLAAQFRRLSAPMPAQRGAAIFAACCDALDFAHERRISHGDLRPSNVFLLNSGGVRVLGFGAAVSYMPPAIGKAEKLALLAPEAADGATSKLLPVLPDTRDDASALANLARELLVSNPLPRIDDARSNQPPKSELLEQGTPPAKIDTEFEPVPLDEDEDEDDEIPPLLAPGLPKEEPPEAPASVDRSPPTVIELDVSNAPPADTTSDAATASSIILSKQASPEIANQAPATPRQSGTGWKAIGAVLILGAIAWTFTHMDGNKSAQDAVTVQPPVSASSAEQTLQGDTTPSPIADEAAAADAQSGAAEANFQLLAQQPASAKVKTRAAAAPKQEISFDVDALTVSARASAAVLTLKRRNGREGRLRVNWRITPDTAAAGRDFSGPTSGSVVFSDWQVVRALYVPLIVTSNSAGQRRFTVEITDVSNGARVAPNDSVTVNIRDFG